MPEQNAPLDLHRWFNEFPGPITICDAEGVILALNDRACQAFANQGGRALVGRNLLDCHPEPSRSKVREMLQRRQPNVYTIETGGVRKLVYQTPWYEGGQYRGFVEIDLDLPAEMPHFVRGEAQG